MESLLTNLSKCNIIGFGYNGRSVMTLDYDVRSNDMGLHLHNRKLELVGLCHNLIWSPTNKTISPIWKKFEETMPY